MKKMLYSVYSKARNYLSYKKHFWINRKVISEKIHFDQKVREIDFTGQAAGDLIYEYLTSNNPCMVARLGSTELEIIVNYLCFNENFNKYNASQTKRIVCLSGFFNASKKNLDKFSELMLSCMPKVDILGSWMSCGTEYGFGHFRNNETYVKNYLQNAKFIDLEDLNGFHKNLWSRALENKNVLAIHPFANSIKTQYEKRELLFRDKRVLPKFNLHVIKAVQSIAGEKVPFKDWFDALDFMKEQISKIDFDIAIIGCGAYGFPLASFVKDFGKKAVHLGGTVQIMFGIMGKRWETYAEIEKRIGTKSEEALWIDLPNEHWVRPGIDETPKGKNDVEKGCYW
jgi:hypothetical protein